jgi:hypothetical protein
MANVGSLTFDLTECAPRKQTDRERTWLNSAGVLHQLQFWPGPEAWWPFDTTDLPAANEFFREQCGEAGGVVLSLDVTTVAGAEALRGVFKYRSPIPDTLGMYYAAILWLPFQECLYQLNVEAVEGGTTGIREVAVKVIVGDAWPMPQQEEIPIINNEEELQALHRSARVRTLPSDDDQYDRVFPHHPLSLVRSRLAEIIATAKLDRSAQKLRPFRLAK